MANVQKNRLGFVPAARQLPAPQGATTQLRADGVTQSPVRYLDFAVDGKGLHGLLCDRIGFESDYVSPLQEDWPQLAVEAIERLLGERPGDLPDGRTSLYGCPECAGLGCGAITSRLEFDEARVSWLEVGFQDENHPEITLIGDSAGDRSFVFDRAEYEAELRSQLSSFRELADGWVHPKALARRARWQRRRSRFARNLGLRAGDDG